MLGSAESEHPRLTNGEIILEEFHPTACMSSQSVDVTDRQTTCDRKTRALHYSASRGKKLAGLQALPYSERLRLTTLEQLEARRIRADLIFTYKLLFVYTCLDTHDFFRVSATSGALKADETF